MFNCDFTLIKEEDTFIIFVLLFFIVEDWKSWVVKVKDINTPTKIDCLSSKWYYEGFGLVLLKTDITGIGIAQ